MISNIFTLYSVLQSDIEFMKGRCVTDVMKGRCVTDVMKLTLTKPGMLLLLEKKMLFTMSTKCTLLVVYCADTIEDVIN